MGRPKALLFDMDGVLVDVASSYRVAIGKTVEHFSKKGISAARIQAYKNRGGFNNDWDLCAGVLQDRGCNVDINALIDVFQRHYLGDNFDGLIAREAWLLERSILELLHRRHPIGIVTGRPRPEAEHVLMKFDVARYFPVLVTMDDIPPQRGKPDPYGIRLALRVLGATGGWYCGDTIDDMRAARLSEMAPIGIACAKNKAAKEIQVKLLYAHGAAAVLDHVNQIVEVIE